MMNQFLEEYTQVLAMWQGGPIPEMEAPMEIIQHFNLGEAKMRGFNKVGYFNYHGVNVYALGKMAETKANTKNTMEQVTFGG